MKPELIALIAHAVYRAYCASLGDDSMPAWDDAPEAHRASLLAGVQMHLANPDTTPEQAHASWLAAKLADGWTFAEVKDVQARQHPCIKPFEDLPAEQKAKDFLFRGVVHGLAALQLQTAPEVPAAQVPEPRLPAVGLVPVQYIGRRETHTDTLYGSMLKFESEQVRPVPADLARSFLRHPDQFRRPPEDASQVEGEGPGEPSDDDTESQMSELTKRRAKEEADARSLQDMRDQVGRMGAKALATFAMTHYRQTVDKNKTVEQQREQVQQMINAYGL